MKFSLFVYLFINNVIIFTSFPGKVQMKVSTILKNEWSNYYMLTPITQSRFYKIAGCFALGFELIKIPGHGVIRPYFAIYPLWEDNSKECFKSPCKWYGLLDKRRLQVQLPIEKMLEERQYVFSLFDDYIGFDITKDISSHDMLSLINKEDIYGYNNPWRLMSVSESIIYQSIYLGDKNMFDSGIENLNKTFVQIRPYIELVESRYGKLDKLKDFFKYQFDTRDLFLQKVTENAINSKVKMSVRLY